MSSECLNDINSILDNLTSILCSLSIILYSNSSDEKQENLNTVSDSTTALQLNYDKLLVLDKLVFQRFAFSNKTNFKTQHESGIQYKKINELIQILKAQYHAIIQILKHNNCANNAGNNINNENI